MTGNDKPINKSTIVHWAGTLIISVIGSMIAFHLGSDTGNVTIFILIVLLISLLMYTWDKPLFKIDKEKEEEPQGVKIVTINETVKTNKDFKREIGDLYRDTKIYGNIEELDDDKFDFYIVNHENYGKYQRDGETFKRLFNGENEGTYNITPLASNKGLHFIIIRTKEKKIHVKGKLYLKKPPVNMAWHNRREPNHEYGFLPL